MKRRGRQVEREVKGEGRTPIVKPWWTVATVGRVGAGERRVSDSDGDG